MALKVHKFVRKPLYVDAVRITKENMAEVAEWCGGKLATTEEDGEKVQIIKVRVPRPLSARQTMGYPGDWVLKAKNSFKIYTPRAFDKQFEKVKGTLTKKQADEAGIRPPVEKRAPKLIKNGEIISASILKDDGHPITIVEDGRIKTGALSSQMITPAELEKLAMRRPER